MKKNFRTLVLSVIVALFSVVTTQAQKGGIGGSASVNLSGNASVYQNDIVTYTAYPSPGLVITSSSWIVGGAIIQSQTLTTVTVKWNNLGAQTVNYQVVGSNSGFLQASMAVTVSAAVAPATPGTPTIASQTCLNAVLQKTGTPPSGVTWYWQGTNSAGTSTANNATSNYTASATGTYYLRARNSSGTWSGSSASVTVTLGVIGGATWYADTDGDGLGDPAVTKVQCTQPSGYVSNNSDACPSSHGGGSANGCPVVYSLSNENYVYTIAPQVAVTSIPSNTDTSDYIKSVTYVDGLGRTKQSIAIRQSASQKDIVTHVAYNNFGQQEKEYLPYVPTTAGDGMIKSNALSATNAFYNTATYGNTTNPYAEKTIEKSPLNRVLEQAAPGNDWKKGGTTLSKGYTNGHTIKFEYDANTSTEVKQYGVTTTFANNTYTPTLVLSTSNSGNYLANVLTKTITKDENWIVADGVNKTTEEFKNKKGQVVLKRTYNASVAHDTYYVYDNFGNLTYVLPPKMEGSTATLATINSKLNDLGYQYKYDHRNRLVEKKIPGKGWEYIVYDKLDRPVATQDAILRTTNRWLFTKYDAFGRIVITGKILETSNRTQLQNYINVTFPENRTDRITTPVTIEWTNLYHNYVQSYPWGANSVNLHTINYYDDYAFDLAGSAQPASIPTVYGITPTSNVKGLPTGSKTRVLGTNHWITTVTYYDDKARPIYVYSKNEFLGTTDIVKSKLDFTGKVLETTSLHTNANDNLPTLTLIDKFTYDHAGRLKKQTQQGTNITGEEVIVENTYDELGQLKTKKVGGKTTQSRLQTVDYTYNVRGWLQKINQDGNNDNDLFNFTLWYNDISNTSKKLYNGNISGTSWNTLSTDSNTKTYSYSYDALNRITGAVSDVSHYHLNNVSYDKNGNITALSRNGHTNVNATSFGLMDDLTYTYDSGNKLLKIADAAPIDQFGFKDDAVNTATDTSNDYTYDANGNMLTDTNKGITNITYNHLNLPVEVKFNNSNTQKINYVYDADGDKLQKKVTNGSNVTITQYAEDYTYENNVLQFFTHSEGYVSPDGSGNFKYVYQYLDHLNNVRLSYSDVNNDGIVTSSEILSENHFYPLGLKQKGYNTVVSSNANSVAERFKFNKKEFTEALGFDMYEYGARLYDPASGKFTSIDPKAEEFEFQSPYVYAANSPVYFQEKNGENPIKGFVTAFRIARKAYKVYKKLKKAGKKFTSKHLKDVGLDEIADIAGDLHTVFSGDTSGWDKLGAVADLLVGTDFNSKGKKAVSKALELSSDAKKAKKAKQLAKNKKAGKAGEAKVKKKLEGELKDGETLLENATVKTTVDGKTTRSRPDFTVVSKDGSITKVVDAKTGKATLSKNQKTLQQNGGTLVGKKAGEHAGKKVKPKTLEERKVDVNN